MMLKNNSNNEELLALGRKIRDDLLASSNSRGTAPIRWENDEKFFRNEPPKMRNPFLPKGDMLHFPITQPRINKLGGQVVRTLCNPSTILSARELGASARAESVEQTIQFFFDVGAFESRLRKEAELTAITNHGILHTEFDAIHRDFDDAVQDNVLTLFGNLRYVGFKFNVIHPTDFAVFPNNAHGVLGARTVGHRIFQTVEQVKYLQANNRYRKQAQVQPCSGASIYNAGKNWDTSSQAHSAIDLDTQLCENWVVYHKVFHENGRCQKYRVILNWHSAEVLQIEPWNRLTPYTSFSFLPDQPHSFWTDVSVARNLNQLQTAYSTLWNLFIYGMHLSALPAVFGDGLPDKVLKYFAGDVIGGVKGTVQPVLNSFRTQEFPLIFAKIEQLADQVAHISAAGAGGQLRPNITASEVGAITQAQAQSENDYLMEFASGLPSLANIMRESLYLHFDVWKQIYRDSVPVENPMDLLGHYRWTVHGRNPEATPEMELVKLRELLELCMRFGDVKGRVGGGVDETGMPIQPPIGPFDLHEILKTMVEKMQLSNTDKIMPEQVQQELAGFDPNSISAAAAALQFRGAA